MRQRVGGVYALSDQAAERRKCKKGNRNNAPTRIQEAACMEWRLERDTETN